jgi:hypothetical protein
LSDGLLNALEKDQGVITGSFTLALLQSERGGDWSLHDINIVVPEDGGKQLETILKGCRYTAESGVITSHMVESCMVEVPMRASNISTAEYGTQALIEGDSHLSPSTDRSIGLSSAELKVEWRAFHN